MKNNVLVVHGGGPTAVLNASLYGVLAQAKESDRIGAVYGAIGGSEGILKERFLDLLEFAGDEGKKLLSTPGTAIGSSRYALEEEDYRAMEPILRKYGIRYVLFNGGNGTMDACGKLARALGTDSGNRCRLWCIFSRLSEGGVFPYCGGTG